MKRKRIIILGLQFIFLMIISTKNVFAALQIAEQDIALGINYQGTLNVIGNTSNNLSWESSDPNVATVSGNGVVTGVGIGTTHIRVMEGNNYAYCTVRIISNYVPVSSITLSTSSATVIVGYTRKIDASIFPINASNKKPTYASSNSSIATVDSSGYFTAKKAGTAYIYVTIESKQAVYKVTVVDEVLLNSISIPGNVSLNVGGSKKLTVTYSPADATDKGVTWKSSNNNIVTVDQSGNIKAKSPGNATITVTSDEGSHTATCKVTVINPNTNPPGGGGGTVTTEPNTEPTTTGSSSGEEKKLRSIYLNKNTLSIPVGETQTLTVSYSPTSATDKKVTWTSSDTKIVTVDSEGKVKAIAKGKATITVTSNDGGHTATCEVTVTENDDGGGGGSSSETKSLRTISFSRKNVTLKEGKEKTLEVTYRPEDATNKNVTWTSSNPDVATVTNGVIKAIKVGKTEITAKSEDGDHEAKCTVTVYLDQPVETIDFEKRRQTMYVEDTLTLTPIATPANTMLDNPIWTSSNESVATVIDGVVTSLKVGSTTITVSDESGEITASIIVNVIEKLPDKLIITVDGHDINFDENVKDYTIKIGNENSLNIKTNYDSSRVTINGNKDLKNGSIVTVIVTGETKRTYVFNIKKSEFKFIYIIGIIALFLLVNIIIFVVKGKKKKKK